MDVNFIITCYNREDYWPYMRDILNSYKTIKPHIAYCYSGVKDDEVCDFRCANRGHIEGDTDLMIGGYNFLKNNGVKKWIKLCVDSWLIDEQKILDIFKIMDDNDCVYAGNRWTGDPWWATDIFFSRDNDFEFMRKFTEGAINYIENVDYSIEGWIANLAKASGRYYIIPEREPITGNTGTRFVVDPLSWTMQHDLQQNIQQAEIFRKRLAGNA
jgi:hypothetical protein